VKKIHRKKYSKKNFSKKIAPRAKKISAKKIAPPREKNSTLRKKNLEKNFPKIRHFYKNKKNHLEALL
jgi:hypothetical protein